MAMDDELPKELREKLARHNELHDEVHEALNHLAIISLSLEWVRDAHEYNDVGKTYWRDIRFEELKEVRELLEKAEVRLMSFMEALNKPRGEDVELPVSEGSEADGG